MTPDYTTPHWVSVIKGTATVSAQDPHWVAVAMAVAGAVATTGDPHHVRTAEGKHAATYGDRHWAVATNDRTDPAWGADTVAFLPGKG